MTTRILFTGHRDAECATESLDLIASQFPDAIWLHGNNRFGFDACVEAYAVAHNIPTLHFNPDYERYDSKKAPLIRNNQMLKLADVVVALYDGRKTGGTYYTVNKAKKLKLEIIYITRS